MKTKFKMNWTCTDPDTGQWGRQVSPTLYLFCEGVSEKPPVDLRHTPITVYQIDLGAYTVKQVESIIAAYGYTLWSANSDKSKLIYDLYPKEYNFIIAECIFKSEFADKITI